MTRKNPMHDLSRQVIDRIRQTRQSRGMSVQQLADAITARGYRIGRSSLAEMEIGRKVTVPVDLVLIAAQVLAVPVSRLLPAPPDCRTCKGRPPIGFTCNQCGASKPNKPKPSIVALAAGPNPAGTEDFRETWRGGSPNAIRRL